MKRPQYFTIFIALAALCLLWVFGRTETVVQAAPHDETKHDHDAPAATSGVLTSSISIDSVLSVEEKKLDPQHLSGLEMVKAAGKNASNPDQKLHHYHQLSSFWKEQAKAFIPYAWYVAEGARLENSEKNLNFAGHLFLDNLQHVENTELVKWMALQAKDLFERTLKLNAANDSAKVGLGATYMFGGISNAPMEGIGKIREVVTKDSTNVYAQMTLAMGSLMSGQTEKARERLETVTKLDPKNLQAVLLLADIYEKQDKVQEAIACYQKALPLVRTHEEMKVELEKRIDALKKQK